MGRGLLDLLVLLVEPAELLHCLRHGAESTCLHHQGLGHRQDRLGNLAAQPLGDLVHRRLVGQALQGTADLGGHGRGLDNRLMGGPSASMFLSTVR
ncbi:hypothetical protein ACH4UV_38900 [Streptomyces sp. NPDC020802]|uniref:hypothetical protein n=1 Tax=Streptomyces sp. NPDC020802 TaxID=3365094 RepID=UPI003799C355